ncbi:MAG: hypothetical protein ACRD01_12365 [Terriglobales bacterium]
MNGGRLSNDATFLLGVAELRTQLDAPQPDAALAQRAITRIALRFPEEGEQLAQLWLSPERPACAALLTEIEALHQLAGAED